MSTPSGSAQILSVHGIPVFVHWSFPLASFVACALVRFELPESLFVCVVFTQLLLLHECAHAIAASKCGVRVASVRISGFGGECSLFGPPKSFGGAIMVASAGLLAQGFVLVLAIAYVGAFEWPQSALGESLLITLIVANGCTLFVNLIPWKRRNKGAASDGYLIYKLLANRLRGRAYSYPDTSITFAPRTRLLELHGFTPAGFSTGIEILNDNTTPMAFVVDVVERHLALPRPKAIELVLQIHAKGGLVIPVEPFDRAVRAAAAITAEAASNTHRLTCRAVDNRRAVAASPAGNGG